MNLCWLCKSSLVTRLLAVASTASTSLSRTPAPTSLEPTEESQSGAVSSFACYTHGLVMYTSCSTEELFPNSLAPCDVVKMDDAPSTTFFSPLNSAEVLSNFVCTTTNSSLPLGHTMPSVSLYHHHYHPKHPKRCRKPRANSKSPTNHHPRSIFIPEALQDRVCPGLATPPGLNRFELFHHQASRTDQPKHPREDRCNHHLKSRYVQVCFQSLLTCMCTGN